MKRQPKPKFILIFTPKRMAVEPDKNEDDMGWIRMAIKLEKSVR